MQGVWIDKKGEYIQAHNIWSLSKKKLCINLRKNLCLRKNLYKYKFTTCLCNRLGHWEPHPWISIIYIWCALGPTTGHTLVQRLGWLCHVTVKNYSAQLWMEWLKIIVCILGRIIPQLIMVMWSRGLFKHFLQCRFSNTESLIFYWYHSIHRY